MGKFWALVGAKPSGQVRRSPEELVACAKAPWSDPSGPAPAPLTKLWDRIVAVLCHGRGLCTGCAGGIEEKADDQLIHPRQATGSREVALLQCEPYLVERPSLDGSQPAVIWP